MEVPPTAGAPRGSFKPSEAWLAAFARQSTPELYQRAARFATTRVRMLNGTGALDGENDPDDLVADIVADTLNGDLAWDPSRESLEQNIQDAICFRTRDAYRRARRYPHVSLSTAGTGLQSEIEHTLARNSDPVEADELAEPRMTRADAAVLELRSLAEADPQVLQFLDCYSVGTTKRVDVMQALGISEKVYTATRRRLLRYAEQISPHQSPDADSADA